MQNPFFKNNGPFKVSDILSILNINDTKIDIIARAIKEIPNKNKLYYDYYDHTNKNDEQNILELNQDISQDNDDTEKEDEEEDEEDDDDDDDTNQQEDDEGDDEGDDEDVVDVV